MVGLKKASIGRKITLGFGAIGLVFLVAMAAILHEFNAIRTDFEVSRHKAALMGLAKDANSGALSTILDVSAAVASTDPTSLKSHTAAIETSRSGYLHSFEQLKSAATTEKTQTEIANILKLIGDTKDADLRALNLAEQGRHDDAIRVFTTEALPKIQIWRDAFATFNSRLQKELDEASAAATTRIATSILIILLAGAAAALAIVILGTVTTRGLTRPISRIVGVLGKVAEGDMRVAAKIDSEDEIGQLGRSVNATIEHLREMIAEVSGAANSVASGATELSASSEEMSATTQEIARSGERLHSTTESVAAAITQFQASVEQVEGSVKVSIQNTTNSVDAAEAGSKDSEAMADGMIRIQSVTKNIAKAVSVIQDIAKQTNLLSLNAAIEAAKAGQQGKGFAVVAEEVRKLAERSRQATIEIAALTEETHVAVDEGTMAAKRTADHLGKIHDSVNTVSVQVKEIGIAAKEQANTAGEIARRMADSAKEVGQNAAATHQLAATVQEISHTASDLAKVSEKMAGAIKKFQV